MELKKILRPYMRRLRFETFMQACFAAFSAGFAVAMLFTTITRIFAFEFHFYVLVGVTLGIALTAGIVSYIKVFRMSYQVVLRRIDQAGLQDRLVTMAQFMDDDSFIAKRQREDTVAILKKLKPKAVPFRIPLLTATIALSLVTVNLGMSVWPTRETPVDVDLPITDLYTESNPIIEDLVGDLKDQYEQLPDSPLKDQIGSILENLENIQNSDNKTNSDNISDLEEELERIEELIKENQVSKTFGQILSEFPYTKELGIAIYERNQSKIETALDNLRPNLFDMMYKVLALVEQSDADEATKEQLTLILGDAVVSMNATKESDTADKLGAYRRAITAAGDAIKGLELIPTGDIADLLATTPEFGTLGAALQNKDVVATADALEAFKTSLTGLELETLDSTLATYIGVLTTAKAGATTSKTEALYVALDGFIGNLTRVREYIDVGYTLDECLELLEVGMEESASHIMGAVSQRTSNESLCQQVVMELEKIIAGELEKEALQGFRDDFSRALELAGFSIYTPLELVMALVKVSDGFGGCIDILNKGRDYTTTLNLIIATAKIEIWDAICGEVENEEVLEDIKDKIEEAIDEILKQDKNEDVIAPDQNQNKDEEESEENQDDQNSQMPPQQDDNQGDSSQNGPGEDNLNGLTFYNPLTGQNEVLTQETLNSFKEAMDTAIENETYTEDQKDAMERYYDLISQKFNQNNS